MTYGDAIELHRMKTLGMLLLFVLGWEISRQMTSVFWL